MYKWWPKSGAIRLSVLLGVVLPAAYGFITYVFFDRRAEFGTLSLAFLVITPPVLGFLAVFFSPRNLTSSWAYSIMAPWMPSFAVTVVTGLMAWEAWFCIFLGLPLILFLASVGGVAARLALMVIRRFKEPYIGGLVLVALLPFLTAAFTDKGEREEVIRTVHSSIVIAAPVEVVWENITNLEPIRPEERGAALFSWVGLPRPIEARMACEETGCVRRGVWEDGLAFDGTITAIEPGVSYWVSLEADISSVRDGMAPLSEIGGSAFDMVDDGYVIEDLGDGRVRLHLYSSYRLRTGINGYASFWLDFLLRDIQRHILSVEKLRSESQL